MSSTEARTFHEVDGKAMPVAESAMNEPDRTPPQNVAVLQFEEFSDHDLYSMLVSFLTSSGLSKSRALQQLLRPLAAATPETTVSVVQLAFDRISRTRLSSEIVDFSSRGTPNQRISTRSERDLWTCLKVNGSLCTIVVVLFPD